MTTVIRTLANGETEIQNEAGAVILRVRPGASVQAALDALPKPPVPVIRVITLAAFLARITPAEYAGMQANPMLGYALACQLAEPNATVNLDSLRLGPLLGLAVQAGILTSARAVELQLDGTADEAAG
jgi:hypothetical protein